VVVTPQHHERVIDLAVAHGLDILCEKPIADTMEASIRIARKVGAAGRKMAVTMSHRFDQDKTTLRRIVRSGILGKINAIGFRFQGDMRQHMAWSSLFRHRMRDPLLIEGAIHHLDIIADLAGAASVSSRPREAGLGPIRGDTDGIVTMQFDNVRVYEARCPTPSASTRSTRSTSASTASSARRSSITATSKC
jgi:predicted dehydrogenase